MGWVDISNQELHHAGRRIGGWSLGNLTVSEGPRQPFKHYPDTGCEIAPHCLECPLPACKYDLPPKRAQSLVAERRVTDLFEGGLDADAVAGALGLSKRQVYRRKSDARRRAEEAI